MDKIVATTDVLYGEVRHAKGTQFEIADAPQAGTLQVDRETARRWVRQQWAKPAGVPAPAAPAPQPEPVPPAAQAIDPAAKAE